MSGKHIVHVNQHVIKKNRKLQALEREPGDFIMEPVLTVKGDGQNRYGFTAEIWFRDELVGEFVYRPHNPLSCGAHVWFQTEPDEDIEVKVR